MRTMLAAMVALGLAASAGAQAPACEKVAAPFDSAQAVTAARTLGGNPTPPLTLGTPVEAALVPMQTVILAAPLGKPLAAGDKGGLLRLRIGLGGTYRIALGGKAWIDLVRTGKSLPSSAHAHGEACSGITKQVDFTLEPGDYVLQLSDTQADTLPLLVTRLP